MGLLLQISDICHSFVASALHAHFRFVSLTAIASWYAKNQMVDVEPKVMNVMGSGLAILVEMSGLIFSVLSVVVKAFQQPALIFPRQTSGGSVQDKLVGHNFDTQNHVYIIQYNLTQYNLIQCNRIQCNLIQYNLINVI